MKVLNSPVSRSACLLTMLDPQSIDTSGWGEPDRCEFIDARFEQLKSSICSYGGNLQPVKVRTTPHLSMHPERASHIKPLGAELVFGYARHRACLELGLPVLAMVDSLSEVEALKQFVFEIHDTARWRPWRLAKALSSALNSGLFPSLRRAAEVLALPGYEVSFLREIGRLPDSIRQAYGNVNVTPRHAKNLITAYSLLPHRLAVNSTRRDFSNCRTAAAVLATLWQDEK